jgi:hypothetical protein
MWVIAELCIVVVEPSLSPSMHAGAKLCIVVAEGLPHLATAADKNVG